MENKDQPAFGLSKVRFISLEGTVYYDDTKLGLTKRELIAAIMTAAFVQCPQNGNPLMFDENAKHGMAQADALLTNLLK